jgi:hypothetical protein
MLISKYAPLVVVVDVVANFGFNFFKTKLLTFSRTNILLMIPVLSSWTKRAISFRVTKTTRDSDPKSQIAFLLAV